MKESRLWTERAAFPVEGDRVFWLDRMQMSPTSKHEESHPDSTLLIWLPVVTSPLGKQQGTYWYTSKLQCRTQLHLTQAPRPGHLCCCSGRNSERSELPRDLQSLCGPYACACAAHAGARAAAHSGATASWLVFFPNEKEVAPCSMRHIALR